MTITRFPAIVRFSDNQSPFRVESLAALGRVWMRDEAQAEARQDSDGDWSIWTRSSSTGYQWTRRPGLFDSELEAWEDAGRDALEAIGASDEDSEA